MDSKLVVCVRKDLNLGKGKLAAQVGHASVKAALNAKRQDKKTFDAWTRSGQAKVVVGVKDLGELDAIAQDAKDANLPTVRITDAGRTQVRSGTVTCVGIGPAPASRLDPVTGHLSLL